MAVNRAYYALFYAVSTLLLEDDRKSKKHSGLRAAFNRAFVKPGRFSKTNGELYNCLYRDHQKKDYIAFAEFDKAYVEKQLRGCEAFLRNVRHLLNSLPSDEEDNERGKE